MQQTTFPHLFQFMGPLSSALHNAVIVMLFVGCIHSNRHNFDALSTNANRSIHVFKFLEILFLYQKEILKLLMLICYGGGWATFYYSKILFFSLSFSICASTYQNQFDYIDCSSIMCHNKPSYLLLFYHLLNHLLSLSVVDGTRYSLTFTMRKRGCTNNFIKTYFCHPDE